LDVVKPGEVSQIRESHMASWKIQKKLKMVIDDYR
jgi:hypothetical protein